ncbi:hypothetical protein [Virgisporangium aurantiacum]|uniref:LexA family protein n=1 Tax=Virgisporangium aurantiacum TaxID=175570 RepID=UPI0035710E6B
MICYWAERNGYPPTVREFGAAVGLGSHSSVAHHLATLLAGHHLPPARRATCRGGTDPACLPGRARATCSPSACAVPR